MRHAPVPAPTVPQPPGFFGLNLDRFGRLPRDPWAGYSIGGTMRGKVLVVEEDAIAGELEGGLQVHGYTVTCLGDGESAIARATTEPFDVIILAAELDGFGVCDKIKTDPTTRTVPVLVMG